MNNLKDQLNEYGDKLINDYKHNLLTENDLKLLSLIFSKAPTQEELDNFLKTYDIEVAGGYKALMLSYFMRMYPELNFSKYESPRLKGVFNFYRFQNMKLISYFMKIGKVFNENNIPMLILKGFAMKYLRQDLSRAMGDIDILVPENKFIQAIDICKDLGYRLDVYVHSIDIHEPSSDEGIMDIHRYIDMKNKSERPLNKFLFKRARKAKYNGIEVLVPTNEDLLFLSLVNLALNLKGKTSNASTLYVLFDCQYLINKPNFDWDIVLDNMKLTKSWNEIAFAVKFINNIIPNLLPKQFVENKMINNCINNYCINILYLERYFTPLQRLARRITLGMVLKNKISFWKYINLKIHYKYCKFITARKNVLAKLYFLKLKNDMKINKKAQYIKKNIKKI